MTEPITKEQRAEIQALAEKAPVRREASLRDPLCIDRLWGQPSGSSTTTVELCERCWERVQALRQNWSGKP